MGSLRRSLFRSPVEKTGRKVQRELITGGFTLTLPLTGVRGRTAVRQTRSVTENHSQPVDLCSSVTVVISHYLELEKKQKTSMTVIKLIHKENN